MSHRKWNNGLHCLVWPVWPIIPFCLRHSASPPAKDFANREGGQVSKNMKFLHISYGGWSLIRIRLEGGWLTSRSVSRKRGAAWPWCDRSCRRWGGPSRLCGSHPTAGQNFKLAVDNRGLSITNVDRWAQNWTHPNISGTHTHTHTHVPDINKSP